MVPRADATLAHRMGEGLGVRASAAESNPQCDGCDSVTAAGTTTYQISHREKFDFRRNPAQEKDEVQNGDIGRQADQAAPLIGRGAFRTPAAPETGQTSHSEKFDNSHAQKDLARCLS